MKVKIENKVFKINNMTVHSCNITLYHKNQIQLKQSFGLSKKQAFQRALNRLDYKKTIKKT